MSRLPTLGFRNTGLAQLPAFELLDSERMKKSGSRKPAADR